MRKLARLMLASMIFITPAAAAERALLSPASKAANALASSATELSALRDAARQDGKLRVIVGLKVPFAPEGELSNIDRSVQRVEIANAAVNLRKAFPEAARRNAIRSFDSIPFVTMEVTPAELERLAGFAGTLAISKDQVLKSHQAAAAPATTRKTSKPAAPAMTDYPAATKLINAQTAWKTATGKGQIIAIIGDGIDSTHPLLKGKIVAEACFSAAGSCAGGATRASGKGTAKPFPNEDSASTMAAGVAVGNGDGSNATSPFLSGAAKDAQLIAINTASKSDNGFFVYASDIIEALNKVYELRKTYSNIAAVDVTQVYEYPYSDLYTGPCDQAFGPAATIIANLKSVGVATVSESGDSYRTNEIAFPACLSNIVSVGAVSVKDWGKCTTIGDETAADKVYCLASTSPYLKLFAPGAPIDVAIAGGGYRTEKGSHLSAGYVAGAFAVLKQAYSSSTVDENLKRLRMTGKLVTDYRATNIIVPRIDVAAALKAQVVTLRLNLDNSAVPGKAEFNPAGSKQSCRSSCDVVYTKGTRVTITYTPDDPRAKYNWIFSNCGKLFCTLQLAKSTTVSLKVTK